MGVLRGAREQIGLIAPCGPDTHWTATGARRSKRPSSSQLSSSYHRPAPRLYRTATMSRVRIALLALAEVPCVAWQRPRRLARLWGCGGSNHRDCAFIEATSAPLTVVAGRNDKRTKKGKIYAGSNGKSRPRKPGGEKGPVDPCRGGVHLLFHRPIGATVARQIPVLKVTCSNHVSVTRRWSRTCDGHHAGT